MYLTQIRLSWISLQQMAMPYGRAHMRITLYADACKQSDERLRGFREGVLRAAADGLDGPGHLLSLLLL
jgi:hypothetical protein